QTILELSFWIRTPVNWQMQHFKLSSWRSRNKLEIFSAAIFSHEASSSGDVSSVNPMPKAWPILTFTPAGHLGGEETPEQPDPHPLPHTRRAYSRQVGQDRRLKSSPRYGHDHSVEIWP